MAMQTIKVGRCPVCDSIRTEARVDEGHLSARAKCVKCGEQGAKIKVSCKDDLPTKIIDENDEGAPSVEDVAALLSNLLSEVCSESDCDSCIMRGGYTNRIGIGCYSRDTSDVKRALIERFPGWG